MATERKLDIDRDFPTDEEEIIELARKMIEGLTKHPELFPSPPVSVEQLQKNLDRFLVARHDEAVAIEAERKATEAMEAALEKLNAARCRLADEEKQGSDTNVLACGGMGLADQMFAKLSTKDDALIIPKIEKTH